jgi:cAMP-dependent protein kinase regulator
VIDDLPPMTENQKGKMRTSVSAEAFGLYNKKSDFQPPVYPKTHEVKEALKHRLEQAFMFSALNPEELDIVINAMQHVKKHPGENVIKEGDDGDNLYVLEKGTLHCTKVFVRT